MKLRNKKTGEVFDALIRERGCAGSYSIIVCDIKSYEQSKNTLNATHFVLDEYETLTELNEDWEDYKPAEPIINETDVRHILKLWASTNHIPHNSNEIEVCVIDSQKGTITQFYSDGLYAHFWGKVAPDAISGKCYTIDELCGEDE